MAAARVASRLSPDRGPSPLPNQFLQYNCTITSGFFRCISVGHSYGSSRLLSKQPRLFRWISPGFIGFSWTFPISAAGITALYPVVIKQRPSSTHGMTLRTVCFFKQEPVFITDHKSTPKQIAIFVSFYSIFTQSILIHCLAPPTLCRICLLAILGPLHSRSGTFFPLPKFLKKFLCFFGQDAQQHFHPVSFGFSRAASNKTGSFRPKKSDIPLFRPCSSPPLVDSKYPISAMFLSFLPSPPATSLGFLLFLGFTCLDHYTICTQVSLCGGHYLAAIRHFFSSLMQVHPIHLSWTFLTVLFLANEKNRTILPDTAALFQKREDFYLLIYKVVCIIY